MTTKSWPPKDPNEVLDYGFDWTPRQIAGDPILTTTAAVVAGTCVVDSHEVAAVSGVATGYGTVTFLSGGTTGETCELLLRANTGGGRTLDQTIFVKIKDR